MALNTSLPINPEITGPSFDVRVVYISEALQFGGQAGMISIKSPEIPKQCKAKIGQGVVRMLIS